MRYCIILLALLSATGLQAQTLLDAPVPKSTTIVITLDSTAADAAYIKVANLLMDEGFTLAKNDKDLHLLGTEWKDRGGFWRYWVKVGINVREVGTGCQVRLTGMARTENLTPDTRATMGGQYNEMEIQKRTAGGKYWKELDSLALKIGGRYGFL